MTSVSLLGDSHCTTGIPIDESNEVGKCSKDSRRSVGGCMLGEDVLVDEGDAQHPSLGNGWKRRSLNLAFRNMQNPDR